MKARELYKLLEPLLKDNPDLETGDIKRLVRPHCSECGQLIPLPKGRPGKMVPKENIGRMPNKIRV